MAGCLEGIRVLELARFHAGPRAGMLLADMGAEVIKVEPPGGEETRRSRPLVNGVSSYFAAYNRGKKSITLNLRRDEGRAILERLMAQCDVLLENFRPGTMAAMGFSYEQMRQINPQIIYAAVSGFGQYGPYRDHPAFDSIIQAMCGLMHLTGLSVGVPVMTASSVVDRVTALHACIGIVAALYHRQRTGQGQMIDCCLMDAGITLTEIPLSAYAGTHEEVAEGRGLGYKAKDGYVIVSPLTKALWGRLFQIMGREELAADPRFATIAPDREAAAQRRRLVEEWTAQRTVAEVVQCLREAEVPVGPVHTIAQVLEDPHLRERALMVEVSTSAKGGEERILAPGLSIKFSATPGEVGPLPQPGEHTEELLCHLLAFTSEEVARLRAAQVV